MYLLKGAFLAFYWRLFSRVQSRFVYLLYGTTGFVIITYIITLTIHFTWCIPVHRNWTIPLSEFPGTSSIDNLTTLTVGSFLNITTDLMILILPLLIVQSFNMKRREKYGLSFIFAVGIMCVTASVVRYYKLYLPFDHLPVSIDGVRVSILWSTIEITTGMIAFCLPGFRMVLFRAYKRGRDTIRKKHWSIALSPAAEGIGSSDSQHPSTGSSGGKAKKKNLPRHPNTLLTADFVTLHTTISRADVGDPERGTVGYLPNALTSEGNSNAQIIAGVLLEGNYSSPDNPGGCDTTKQSSAYYSSPLPPPTSLKEDCEEYVLMPMQRVYDPSAARTGSRVNLRP